MDELAQVLVLVVCLNELISELALKGLIVSRIAPLVEVGRVFGAAHCRRILSNRVVRVDVRILYSQLLLVPPPRQLVAILQTLLRHERLLRHRLTIRPVSLISD